MRACQDWRGLWRLAVAACNKPVMQIQASRCASNNHSSTSPAQAKLRFDGQTAIVTGAGRGLGREYALLLASRGCNVVVNDSGGSRAGEPSESATATSGDCESGGVAESLAKEIGDRFGSRALANCESVGDESGARRLVQSTLREFGRVDILINNAGILRDRSFAKMTTDDWDQVCQVHLRGSYLVSRECWPQMRKQTYGRIIMTSSTSGLYGNFGQANYSAAKMALIGLSNTLAIEGARSNIFCNTVVPMAHSRMTRDIIPEELAVKLKPAYVAPLVAWLCHKDCTDSGAIYEAAGQWFGRHRLHRSRGKFLGGVADDSQSSMEIIQASWDEISSFERGSAQVDSFGEHLQHLLQELGQQDGEGANN